MSTSTPQHESHQRRRAACERLTASLRAGEEVRVEGLLAEEPGLADDDDAIVDLILAEAATRRELGEAPSVEEWEERIDSMLPDPRRRRAVQALLSNEMTTLPGEPSAEAPPPSRARVGRYQILEEIGRGGMGVVYKARQASPARFVAVKMILSGVHANPRERARLRTEAEAAAKLTHTNIVQVIEADFHEGLPFLAMEFVDGGNLARMIRSMPQSIRWSARLIETLARAIHAAHQQDIVHRDLNPSNILLTQDGVPKIGDFGLAKSLILDEATLQSGRLVGTPSYMAPEQLAGGAKKVDRRTDVYALGAILYEMLTGSPPFRGLTPMETLCQVAEGEIVPPSRLRHGLPGDLETICLKCLQRNPAARYQDAEELADDLRRFQERKPIRARPTPPLRRAYQWARREPQAATFLSLSLLLLLALLFVAGVYSTRLSLVSEKLQAKESVIDAQKYKYGLTAQKAAQGSEDAERRRYDHELHLILEHDRRGETELAIEAFGRLPEEASVPAGFERRYVDRLIHRSARLLTGRDRHKSSVAGLVLSLDGRTAVSGDEAGRVIAWDLEAGGSLAYSALGGAIPIRGLAAACDESGRLEVVAAVQREEDEAAVTLWDASGRGGPWSFREAFSEVAEIGFARGGAMLTVRVRSAGDPSWRVVTFAKLGSEWMRVGGDDLAGAACSASSPGGGATAIGLSDGRVLVWGRTAGDDRTLLPIDPSRPTTLAFSAEGDRLATGWDDGRVVVWDLPEGVPTAQFRCEAGPPVRLAFYRGGRGLVAQEGPRTVALHDLARGRRRPLETSGARPARMAVSPSGDELAIGFADEGTRLWDLEDLASPPRRLSDLHAPSCLEFAPEGQSLYTSFDQESIFVWSMPSAPHPRTPLAGHAREVWSVAFSPDGSLLATGGDDNQIKLWDVASGAELAAIEAHSATVSGLAFATGGRELASVSLDGSWKLWRLIREDTGDDAPPRARLEQARLLRNPGQGQLRCTAYSPDGSLVAASGNPQDILIYEAPAYTRSTRIAQAHSAPVTALAFSGSRPNQLASVSTDRWLRIWDARAGDRIQAQRGYTPLLCLAYSPYGVGPSGPILIAGGAQRRISVWHEDTWMADDPLLGHPAAVRSVAFSHDGLTLATGCDDGAVRLLDVATDQVVLTLDGHHDRINAVAFSPDDGTLATCSHSGEVFLWKAGPRHSPPPQP